MARREEVALRVVRGLVRRPRLADAVFRFDRWGNILGPDRFVDPYPIYERMRESGPISFSRLLQQWAVVGYEEAREVMGSPSFGVAGQMELLMDARPYSKLSDQTRALFLNALLFTDPPLHTRLRAAVSRAFTPRQMQRLKPRVRLIVDRLLQGIANDPTPELMTSIAEPLPIQVIAELIGVPEERWSWVAETSTVLRRVVDPFVTLDPTEIDRTCTELATYYGALADERAAHPTEDLLTDLARSEAEGQINRTELLSLLAILLLAGHETTTGAIGNALVALGRNPQQRDLLRDRPGLWPNAVEELLRYDTVLQTDPRQALENITIAGQDIRAGQNVTIMLGAANRDPARFPDPNRLRVDREDPAPISFGHGIHHCVGAALARLELRIALPAIIDTLGEYAIDDTHLEWKTSLAFRSPTRLPIQRTQSPTQRTVQQATTSDTETIP
jgi:cytochrome P450